MAEDILARIIQTEQEIEERIAAEQKKAEAWLAARRGEIAGRQAADEERLERECAATVEEAIARAEQQAAAIVGQASMQAARLAALEEHTLRQIVREAVWAAIRPVTP